VGEKRGRLQQNLVGALEIPILPFEVLRSLPLFRGQVGALAGIALGLVHPPPQQIASVDRW
jgi:hypothetical protein